MTQKDERISEMALNIEVRNCKHLDLILERLRGLKIVLETSRILH